VVETREQISKVARNLYAERGFEVVFVRDVVKKAGGNGVKLEAR